MAKTRKILSSGQITPPVEFDYATQALMIADQSKQIADFIYFDGTAHWQYLGTVLGTIADYRALSADTTSGVVNLEFSQIQTLVTNSQLVPGRWYYMTDFQTIHLIPNTTDINTGPVEPLLLLATSENTFGSRVYSPQLYPNDILEFDFNNVLCEDGTTARKGKIEFRHNIQSDTYTYYDWRHAKWRRWKILAKQEEQVVKLTETTFESELTFSTFIATTLNTVRGFHVKFEEILTHDAGELALTLKKGAVVVTKPLIKWNNEAWAANELQNTSGMIVNCLVRDAYIYFNFREIGKEIIGTYASYTNNVLFTIGDGLRYDVDINDFQDYFTFNGVSTKGVHIESVNIPTTIGNNIVFIANCEIVNIDKYSRNMTFLGNVFGSDIGSDSYNNVFSGVVLWTRMHQEVTTSYFSHLHGVITRQWMSLSTIITVGFSDFVGAIYNSWVVNSTVVTDLSKPIFNASIEFGKIFIGGTSSWRFRTGFTCLGPIRESLLGWFNGDGVILSSSYFKTSQWDSLIDQTTVDKFRINNLVAPVGDVILLGSDTKGNVVDATAALGGLVGAGAGLSIDGGGDIQLGTPVFPSTRVVGLNEFGADALKEFTITTNRDSWDDGEYFPHGGDFNIRNNTARSNISMVVQGQSPSFDTTQAQISVNARTGVNPIKLVRALLNVQDTGTSLQEIKLGNDNASEIFQMLVTDAINSFGLQYAANYFTNGSLDDRWIPDWGAVKQVPISVKNSVGTEQFLFAANEGVRFEGTGDTTVSFNAGTKTITITSTPGAGGGAGVTTFNGRDGAVVSIAGDYNTSLVTESGNLYFTEARVRSTVLTGFATNTTAITAADSVLVALGKAQGQINERVPITRTLTINGTAGRTTVTGGTQSLAADRTWAVDLVTTGVVAGTYSTVTVDVYGRVTAANNTNISTITLTGNVTGSGTTSIATTIADNAVITTKILNSNVTYAKIQNVTADRILGRTGSTGVVQELTAAQVRTLLNVADGANNYVHPTGFSNQPASALTGASVISQILVNTNGHVTGATSRTLTLANLGYTGVTNADRYNSWLLAASGTAGTQSITSGATVTITAGTGITATRSGGNITISSTVTAAGTNLSIGSNTSTVVRVDSSTGNNVNLSLASNTLAGIMTASTQTIGGNKSFSGNTVIGATGASDGFQRLDVVSVANRALRLRGNATSYFGFDMSIVRTGSNSDVIGRGPSIELFNSETNRANAIQQTTGGLRFGQWNGVGWTPYYRMGENGIMYINTMTALAGGGNLQVNGAINTNSTIVTADPLNGPRHAWKLGRPGTFQDQPDATLFIRVEINGSQYDLLARHL